MNANLSDGCVRHGGLRGAARDVGADGTYHLVNTGEPVSRYDIARTLIDMVKLNCRVELITSDQFPLPAPRPRMEAARNLKLELMGRDWMRAWQDALREYVDVIEASPHVPRLD